MSTAGATVSSPAISRTKLVSLNSFVQRTLPPSTSNSKSPNDLIVVFGWMDAQSAHLQKYVDALSQNFPEAVIVLVKSSTAFYITSQKRLEANLSPVVDIWDDMTQNSSRDVHVMLYILSNGGGFQFTVLRKMLAERSSTQSTLLVSRPVSVRIALVLDSAPGEGDLETAFAAFAPSSGIKSLFVLPVVAVLWGAWYLVNAVARNPPVFLEMRKTLNEKNLLPVRSHQGHDAVELGANEVVYRLYIYSDKDAVTPFRYVETHIEEARRLGFNVEAVQFHGTSHVSHMRSDPERYWGAVKGVWQKVIVSAKL